MTDPFDEYGDRLRRALNAEAESFQPSAEGLERIRERIEAKGTRIQLPWWRPALAVGGALAVLGAVVVSTPGLRDQAFDTLSSLGSERGVPSESTGGQYPGGPPGLPSVSGTGTPTPSVSVSTTPTPSPGTGPDACPSTIPAPVVSTTPNPGETQLIPPPSCPEPTPSTTPTPDPSETTPTEPSPDPGGGGGGGTTPEPAPSTSSPQSGGETGTGDSGTQSGETLSGGSGTTNSTE